MHVCVGRHIHCVSVLDVRVVWGPLLLLQMQSASPHQGRGIGVQGTKQAMTAMPLASTLTMVLLKPLRLNVKPGASLRPPANSG